jgi:adenylate kinase family enzyme
MDGEETFSRVLVVGVTCSGKTKLATEIARRLGVPHVELDALYWGPSWTERSKEEFRESVQSALAQERWVACGNYHGKLHDLTWRTADLIVWLDLPRFVTLARLIRRTLRRVFLRERLWSDNRETLRNTFLSRESLLVWWWKVQRVEPARTLERISLYPNAKVARLRTSKEVRCWLEERPD